MCWKIIWHLECTVIFPLHGHVFSEPAPIRVRLDVYALTLCNRLSMYVYIYLLEYVCISGRLFVIKYVSIPNYVSVCVCI